jgi:hypothetical protein
MRIIKAEVKEEENESEKLREVSAKRDILEQIVLPYLNDM